MTAVLWLPETPPAGEWEAWEFSRWGPWLSVRLLHILLYVAGAFLLDQFRVEASLMQRAVILDASAGRSRGRNS